ncbi:MAG: DUF2723 domain-containing protein [Calditrichaeota bacterium]|nr:MAG: DUF2723 domain-containing protein [Calditrichota bacterium]
MNSFLSKIDRTNLFVAIAVYIVSFIVYALTVQQTFSFWDCGEFIACSTILGVPHPPGTPLFVLIGRIMSVIPIVEDISWRVNFLSVIFSAFTAMFSYLLTYKIVGYFFDKESRDNGINKFIAVIGGIAGAFFVAFSRTNWGNSVEAEVYGMALALSVMIVWLTLIYFENQGTMTASKIMIFTLYMALLGVGVHMTVFLVVPVCALFFLLDKSATQRDWLIVCGFIIAELLLIMLLSNLPNASNIFKILSVIFAGILVMFLYKKINWAILVAIGSVSTIMMSFSLYIEVFFISLVVLILMGVISKKKNLNLQWKTGLAIIIIAFIGVSVHLFIPIRSSLNPRIDENNPSRDFRTFVNFLDRKQYGQVSMIDRMFQRRGAWENQFGRHPNMGFWSYFEEQYSNGSWTFIFPFFALGLIGLITAIRKRLEVGLPFLVLLLISSAGLVLYMNFADGTMYNQQTGDAYLEVRNRDYFFTPAFVFFGIAMGAGVSAVMAFIKDKIGSGDLSKQKMAVYASSILVLLPLVSFGHNYHTNDRSDNHIPYNYAKNILDTCEPNAILFTSGDNDTFPLWCIQEVYDYRKDVTVVNLSLLNTDWYVEQMKNRYDVPISLTDEQILWHPMDDAPGGQRPLQMFVDKPRKRRTYLTPSVHGGRIVKVQDMMVDEIVLENKWERPIYFSSPPYAESPLNLRDRATAIGVVYKLEQEPKKNLIDSDLGYKLYMDEGPFPDSVEAYVFGGYESSEVYRDDNATGVYITYGVNSTRLYDDLLRNNDTTRAIAIAEKTIEVYPEYWQSYLLLGDLLKQRGDSAAPARLMQQLHDTLTSFLASNPENLFYMQDLGISKLQLGELNADPLLKEQGIDLLWDAFRANPNSNYAFRKLISSLSQIGRTNEILEAARMFGEYKVNRTDPVYQQIMGMASGR